MRQWLAFIFLFIFSLQVLPAKKVVKLICKGQRTEQSQDNYSDDDGAGDEDNDSVAAGAMDIDFILPEPAAQLCTKVRYCQQPFIKFYRSDVSLPTNQAMEIPSPPPDVVCQVANC